MAAAHYPVLKLDSDARRGFKMCHGGAVAEQWTQEDRQKGAMEGAMEVERGRVPLGVAVAKQQRRRRMSIVYCTSIRWPTYTTEISG